MAQPTNAQLARRWFDEVWNQRRDSTVHELLHPNVVGHMEGGVDVRSPAHFLEARAALLEGLPDLHLTIEAVISEGDVVVVRWSVTATHSGPGLGLEPSFRRAAFRGMSWIVFSEGRIVEGWDSWNQGLLLQQLGAPPGTDAGAGAA